MNSVLEGDSLSNGSTRISDLRLTLATAGCSLLAGEAVYVSAVELGAAVNTFGISTSSAGTFVSIELAAMSISSIVCAQFCGKVRARQSLLVAAVIMLASQLACAVLPLSQVMFFALRIVASTASGFCAAVSFGLPALSSNYVRVSSLSMVITNIGFFAMYQLLTQISGPNAMVGPLMIATAGLTGVAICLQGFAPARRIAGPRQVVEKTKGLASPGRVILFFGGSILSVLGLSIAYSLAERMGSINGLPATQIISAMGWMTIVIVLCSVVTAWIGERFGFVLPIAGALLMGSVSGYLLVYGTSISIVALGLGLCDVGFLFASPFIMAVTVQADPTVRLPATLGASIGLAYAAGPLAGSLLVDIVSYRAIGPVTLLACLIALVPMLPLALSVEPLPLFRRLRRRESGQATI